MMDKSCHSSGEESSAINPNLGKEQYLKQLNKFSHKIAKPLIRKPFEFDHHPPPPAPAPLPVGLDLQQQQQQHQPPVYNVSKSEFRDVVQKLTGSPAHERLPETRVPPVKPQSSRLQRIRPPPLEPPRNPSFRPGGNFFAGQRPLSPLPPLPAVHATAESPISAYMRCFQTNTTSQTPALDFPAPAPSSPLPFGCLNSPKSQYPMLSPGFPFSPTNQFGFQQLTPLSPTPPAPSPRWKTL